MTISSPTAMSLGPKWLQGSSPTSLLPFAAGPCEKLSHMFPNKVFASIAGCFISNPDSTLSPALKVFLAS